VRLAASLAFQGFGAAVLPATAVPTAVNGAWKRLPIKGLARRSVGLAYRRRGMLSPQAQGVAGIVRGVVRAQATDQPGLHLALPAPS
jgi:LysR family hydrogen peroxide-inducible transcriptional activator